jgi:hypothetical protein
VRIPTGNFGNVTPQANPTRVGVSNVGQIGNAVAGWGLLWARLWMICSVRRIKLMWAATQAILTDLDAKSSDRWENPETGALVTRQGFKSSGVGLDMDKLDSSDYEEPVNAYRRASCSILTRNGLVRSNGSAPITPLNAHRQRPHSKVSLKQLLNPPFSRKPVHTMILRRQRWRAVRVNIPLSFTVRRRDGQSRLRRLLPPQI